MPSIQKQPIKAFIKHIASLDGEPVQFPVKYIPDDITIGIEDAQTTANTAKNTAEAAQTTANTAKNTAEAAQSTANTAKNTAEAAQSTANTAKNTAEAAQSTANGAFRIYQKTEDATISIPQLRGSASGATLIGDANIAYGSIVTISNSNYSGSAIWNGSSVNITTKTSVGVNGPQIALALKPSGKYEIKNVKYGTIFAESTLAYKKVVVPEVAYSISDGAWIPPYTVCSHLYIAGQTSGTAHTIYKMTVDDTGVPSFTDTGDATNKFTPVTPSELAAKQDVLTDSDKQSIVKTGMTSGAAWTDAERLAALQRLGCIVGEDGIVRWTAQTGG